MAESQSLVPTVHRRLDLVHLNNFVKPTTAIFKLVLIRFLYLHFAKLAGIEPAVIVEAVGMLLLPLRDSKTLSFDLTHMLHERYFLKSFNRIIVEGIGSNNFLKLMAHRSDDQCEIGGKEWYLPGYQSRCDDLSINLLLAPASYKTSEAQAAVHLN